MKLKYPINEAVSRQCFYTWVLILRVKKNSEGKLQACEYRITEFPICSLAKQRNNGLDGPIFP